MLNYILPNKEDTFDNKDISMPDNRPDRKREDNITNSDKESNNKSGHVHEINKEVQEIIKDATCTNKGEYEIIEYCEYGIEIIKLYIQLKNWA